MEAIIKKEERLNNILDHISKMPPLSTTVTKLLEICNNSETSPNDLIRVISLDPVLTGKVLSLINSAYYSLPNKAKSLTRAVILLGLNTVTNLALSTAVLENFGTSGSFRAFSMDAFWAHSICVGVTAKTIAAILKIPLKERETYFVAGLLHDLGKIPINISYPNEYARILESDDLEQNPSCFVEDVILGFDHCMVGGLSTEKWRLDQALNDTLCYHHNPDEAREENRQLAAIVALGNIYANIIMEGSSTSYYSGSQMLNYLPGQVGVEWSTLSDFRETILDEIEKAKVFLQVSKKG